MSVDLKQEPDGRSHFVLGPVERWVAGLVALAVVSGFGWLAKKFDEQGKQINALVTQAAVTNGSIQGLSAQLTDVPQLRRDVVELRVRVNSHEEEIKELRQTRGLK